MKSSTLSSEKTALTLLDVCGSCITDVVYNFLFDRAIVIHERTSMGLTEAYRQVLAEYINESNSAKFYSVLLNTLHHYVHISTVFQDLSYPDCVSLYAGLFVPQMYIQSLTAEQKLNILTMIIGNTVKEFINEILKEHIRCIIDDHQDPINVEVLQDSVLKILIRQREVSYDRFIESQQTPTKPQKKKAMVASSKSLIKISNVVKKTMAKRSALEKKNTILIQKNKNLVNQINELKKMFLAQLDTYRTQTALVKELEKQMVSNKSNDQIMDKAQMVVPINETIEEQDTSDDEDMFSVQYIDT